MTVATRKRTRAFADAVVAELHRVRRRMFDEAGGKIDRYLEIVRAEVRSATIPARRRTTGRRTAADPAS